ncbi:MAG: RNA polymerase sigma factor [Bryobacteraceae bacterium]|nr:RNA polymerase sigma factor [Bryobacteraceae bacterium]MDW8380067.1 RNA polymerase sigma factor [Bryobacterales bacterium]
MAKYERLQDEELLVRYAPALRRLARSYTRDPYRGDDLFQDIVLEIWKAMPRFRGDCSERTWVYRIAHNTALSYLTSERKRQEREHNETCRSEPSARATQEQNVLHRERQQILWRTVSELPLAERQLVTLYLEGLSLPEIEQVTGLRQGNIATRLSRIRQKLAAYLREKEVR